MASEKPNLGSSAPLRVGTRGSDLALYQARRVAAMIEARLGRTAEIVIVETTGDKDRTTPLASMGGAGVFVKELERALEEGRVDVAVHSLKDLPTRLAPGLALAAVPERVDPCDVLVARAPLADLPKGARIGTSSRRRRAFLLEMRPDLACVEIRGNVPTRVEKCRSGEFDAILLAGAGLARLGLALGLGLAAHPLPGDSFVCAPGQGALAIETREADASLLAPLGDARVTAEVEAERALLRVVEGGCSVPLGAHARTLADGRIELRAALAVDEARTPPRIRRALVRAATPEAAASLAFRVLSPDGLSAREMAERRAAAAATQVDFGPTVAEAASLQGATVIVTRDDPDLEAALAARGARVRISPAIETAALEPRPALPKVDWTLVASARTAPLLGLIAADGGAGAGAPREDALRTLGRVGAVGAATAEALGREGIPVDLIAPESSGGGLAGAFLALQEPPGTRVLLPGARDTRPELGDRIAAAGFDVRRVVLYETRPLAPEVSGADVVVLASPSAVRAAAGGLRGLPPGARFVAIGGTTRTALEEWGLGARTLVAERPTTEAIVAAVARALAAARA